MSMSIIIITMENIIMRPRQMLVPVKCWTFSGR